MSRRAALLALALPLLIVACGGASATPTPAPTVAPQPSVAASVAPAGTSAPESEEPDEPRASLATVPSGAPATTVAVELVDYAFKPDAISVPAGKVTFLLSNTSGQEHEFEIFKGDVVVDEAEGLVPGLTREFVVTLPAGDYTIVCKLADHEARGMKGTLTVTAS